MGFRTAPTTRDYQLGRGSLFLEEKSGASSGILERPTGTVRSMREVGVLRSFTVAIEEDTIEHRNTLDFDVIVDKELSSQRKINISLEVDNFWDFQNLAAFLQGSEQSYEKAAVASYLGDIFAGDERFTVPRQVNGLALMEYFDLDLGGTLTFTFPGDGAATTGYAGRSINGAVATLSGAAGIPLERWIDLDNFEFSEGNVVNSTTLEQRALFFDLDTNRVYTNPFSLDTNEPQVSVRINPNQGSANAGQTLVLGEDFELDHEFGRIKFLKKTSGTQYVQSGEMVDIAIAPHADTVAAAGSQATYAAGAAVVLATAGLSFPYAIGMSIVQAFQNAAYSGRLEFISVSPIDGVKRRITIPAATLRGSGDMSLIGEEFGSIALQGTASASDDAALQEAGSDYLTVETLGRK